MLPRVFERLEAGDPGDPQSTEGVSWAGLFEEDYATVDWSQTAREIHNQVRAWRHMFGAGDVEGPIAEVDGERRSCSARASPTQAKAPVPSEDGRLWIVESERSSTPWPAAPAGRRSRPRGALAPLARGALRARIANTGPSGPAPPAAPQERATCYLTTRKLPIMSPACGSHT